MFKPPRAWCRPSLLAIVLPVFCFVLGGCGASDPGGAGAGGSGGMTGALDAAGVDYAKLVLAVGKHDADYVDAFYGPEAWRTAVDEEAAGLPEIRGRAEALARQLAGSAGAAAADPDELIGLRHNFLSTQIGALISRVAMLEGAAMTFDEESQALYDAVAPTRPDAYFQSILDELEVSLPGPGSLTERYRRFKDAFIIPPERLDAVFRAAIDACRERTLEHLELPAGESFVIEYVTDKSWSGYNWYQGNFKSLIQVNTDLPIHIDRAIDLACHEGYPGHHVYNMLLEQRLVRERGWVEFQVYPLFSPQSLIAEGTANYGIVVAFPGDRRVAFERETLFPLAGLDPEMAEMYYRLLAQVERLGYADNEAARRYLDGQIDAAAAAEYLTRYGMTPPDRAAQRVRFFDQYRSYVINYNLGQDLVRSYVETRAGGTEDPDRLWDAFGKLLASPRLPSGLR